jgi:hypothetical protein
MVVMPAMVVMVPMVVVMMTVVMVAGPPHAAAVGVARTPVMMADADPAHIVHHVGVDDPGLHRRRRNDGRAGVRRSQHRGTYGHRCSSQTQKKITHL